LGPSNIVVNPDGCSIGLIDWELAGFVPRHWIRTKFHVCSRLDLSFDEKGILLGEDLQDVRVEWRKRVGRQLGRDGFPEVIDQWVALEMARIVR
jgi:hypothetical protein